MMQHFLYLNAKIDQTGVNGSLYFILTKAYPKCSTQLKIKRDCRLLKTSQDSACLTV